MKKILITGGPVHAYLDNVKIITNRFKGGLMVDLAKQFSEKYDCQVSYLCSKSAKQPEANPRTKCYHHDGFTSYMDRVLELGAEHDAIILGAAVANLIPWKPIKGKFPSHHYKPGDPISLTFKIAERVIDKIQALKNRPHLFGYKLLSGVSHEELISAAYGILLESKATAVLANDTNDLNKKYAVTKERGEHLVLQDHQAEWIWPFLQDEYYSTNVGIGYDISKEDVPENCLKDFLRLIHDDYEDKFLRVPEGYIFGTAAMRMPNGGFITTCRGKNELSSWSWVKSVDHKARKVQTFAGIKEGEVNGKATLNAPLIDHIFNELPQAKMVVHWHKQDPNYRTLPYAPPGTVRDTNRGTLEGGFNIKNHGCFHIIDHKDNYL